MSDVRKFLFEASEGSVIIVQCETSVVLDPHPEFMSYQFIE